MQKKDTGVCVKVAGKRQEGMHAAQVAVLATVSAESWYRWHSGEHCIHNLNVTIKQ